MAKKGATVVGAAALDLLIWAVQQAPPVPLHPGDDKDEDEEDDDDDDDDDDRRRGVEDGEEVEDD